MINLLLMTLLLAHNAENKESIAHVEQNYNIINKRGFNDNTRQTL